MIFSASQELKVFSRKGRRQPFFKIFITHCRAFLSAAKLPVYHAGPQQKDTSSFSFSPSALSGSRKSSLLCSLPSRGPRSSAPPRNLKVETFSTLSSLSCRGGGSLVLLVSREQHEADSCRVSSLYADSSPSCMSHHVCTGCRGEGSAHRPVGNQVRGEVFGPGTTDRGGGPGLTVL